MRFATRCSLAAALSVAVFAASPCGLAADWDFQPTVTLGAQHWDNILLQTEAGSAAGSDTAGVVTLSLPLVGITPRSRTTFSWTPTYSRYREQTGLDTFAYTAGLAWSFQASRRVAWTANAYSSRSDRLTLDYANPANTALGLPRQRVTVASADLGATSQLSNRTSLRVDVFGTMTQYQGLVVGSGETLRATPDPKEVGLLVGLTRSLGPLSSGGVTYRGSHFDEGFYGTRNVHRLLLSWTYGAAERLQWVVTAGAAHVQVVDEGDIPDQSSSTVFSGGLSAHGRVGLRGQLTAGVARDAQPAAGLVGPSVGESAYLAWGYPVGRFSTLQVVGRYARLTPLEGSGTSETLRPVAADTKSRGLRVEYAQALGPHWFVVVGGEKVRQTSDVAAVLDLDYTVYNLGLRWAPLARVQPTPQR